MDNPFSLMLRHYTPDRFFGRQRELDQVIGHILSGNSLSLFGMRTLGKSTLMHYLRDREGAYTHYPQLFQPDASSEDVPHFDQLLFVPANFYGWNQRNQAVPFYAKLLEELKEVLRLTSGPKATYQHNERDPYQMLRLYLKDLRRNSKKHVIFMLDDLDAFIHTVDPPLDASIRALSSDAAFIMITEEALNDLRDAEKYPEASRTQSFLFQILNLINLPPLDEEAAHQLMTVPLNGSPWPQEEQQFVLDAAGRQPLLLTIACEAFLEFREAMQVERGTIAENQREIFMPRFIRKLLKLPVVLQTLRIFWNKMAEGERAVLKQLAAGRAFHEFKASLLLDKLVSKALVYVDSQGGYHVFSELFATFISEIDQAPRYQEVIDPATTLDRIRQSLGQKDQRLLDYLQKHRDNPCTFEDLLRDIWGLPPSNKGKSILEVAIHRIRRAFDAAGLSGGDYIENVRGVGFRYVGPE